MRQQQGPCLGLAALVSGWQGSGTGRVQRMQGNIFNHCLGPGWRHVCTTVMRRDRARNLPS
jgi:hypothetical protein